MSTDPGTLEALRAVANPVDRAIAAALYVQQRQQAIQAALRIRDEAICTLLDQGASKGQVARECCVSLTTVKLARARRPAPV